METEVTIETGQYGRLLAARLKPNQDLVESIEQLCIEHRFRHAVVRGAIGSLVNATLIRGSDDAAMEQHIAGPGVEILTVYGEVTIGADAAGLAQLTGVVSNTAGQIFAGRFKRGGNRSFITVEVSLQEWLPAVVHQDDRQFRRLAGP
jgi:predicted DNA-binding protein with PD1-like motif